MKTRNLFAFTAFALSMSLVGCDSYEPVAARKEIQSGDRACRIESFVLNLTDDTELRGDVYDYDKTIEIGYDITQVPLLNGATATYTLSEGTSISPDPRTAMDYTKPVSFTVTAPDGVTKRVYTTYPVEKIVETYVKTSQLIVKSLTNLGLAGDATAVGVSGGDVVIDKKVYDGKTLAPKGDLNVTGIDVTGNGRIVWLANDDKGTLIGSTSNSGGYEGTTSACIWVWKNGWSEPPVALLGPTGGAYLAGHLSVAGDLKDGTARVIASNQGGGGNGSHMIWTFVDGVRDNTGNYTLNTGIPARWAQMAAPCSTDIAGQWFAYSGAPNSDGANISRVVTWSGWNGSADSTPAIANIVGDAPGQFGLGNYNMGSVRAFTFNNTPMAAIVSTGWPSTYISIVDGEGEFILAPSSGEYANGTKPGTFNGAPQAAYILNESDGCGYVYVFDSTFGVTVYKLEVAIL